jgi:hypothetical protein
MKSPSVIVLLVAATFVRTQEPARDRPRTAAETAVIRGRVLIADGDVGIRKARVSLTPETGATQDPIYTDSDGRFEFSNVTPGRYVASAWKSGWVEARFGARTVWDRPISLAAAAGAVIDDVQLALQKAAAISGRVVSEDGEPLVGMSIAVGRVVAQSETGSAMQHVSVGQDDISGIQLVLGNHARVSGRVVFEGTAPYPAGHLTVEAWSPDVRPGTMPIRVGAEQDGQPAIVGANGRFTLKGMFGRRELRVNQVPAGWTVKSIRAGGRDVLDVPIDFTSGEDLLDVVITLTDRAAEISGRVLGAGGTPASAASVLVFAEDRRRLPRRAHWVKPDQHGRFVVSGLPSGVYLVALAADVDDTRWSTPDYLDAVHGRAERVALGDGEKKSLELQWNEP